MKKVTVKKSVQKAKIKKIAPAKDSTSKKVGSEYGAKQIQVLEGLAPVRKRPAMYIGGTGQDGLHHLIWEVVDNAIDEAMAGHCDEITVELLPENEVRVTDNGRGIPVEKHPQTKKSTLETALTMLHAGGKFGSGGYKVSGGLHGVGGSVVNALSIWMKAEVHRDGGIYTQEYSQGKAKHTVKKIGKSKDTGTIISFKPDPEIFPEISYSWKKILERLRQQAYLTKGVKITVLDQRQSASPESYIFYFEGGIVSYVRHLSHNKEKRSGVIYLEKEEDNIHTEVALRYTNDFNEQILSFANNIHTVEGGTHLIGFKTALTRILNSYARKNSLLKEKDENFTGDDVLEGLTAVISVKLAAPHETQFEGQTKSKLGNPEVKSIVNSIVGEQLQIYMEENPNEARAILGKVVLAAQARQAAKAARDSVIRKGAMEGMTLPGKLADCSSRDASKTELYIVEGDSAGGSAKQGRDREFQAILPLRGKILNVEKARLDRMLANTEIKSLVIALGTNIGEQFDVEKLRYNKIVIMTDADVDGSHIRTLLLTIFYRHFQNLITTGHLYIAQTPLYRMARGKQVKYVYSDAELEKFKQDLKKEPKDKVVKETKKKENEESKDQEGDKTAEKEVEAEAEADAPKVETTAGWHIQRFKGLGEMNPDQLWETTMDPAQRLMRQVTIEDATKVDEIFTVLMGSEVPPRKKFIQTHAQYVKNLDV